MAVPAPGLTPRAEKLKMRRFAERQQDRSLGLHNINWWGIIADDGDLTLGMIRDYGDFTNNLRDDRGVEGFNLGDDTGLQGFYLGDDILRVIADYRDPNHGMRGLPTSSSSFGQYFSKWLVS